MITTENTAKTRAMVVNLRAEKSGFRGKGHRTFPPSMSNSSHGTPHNCSGSHKAFWGLRGAAKYSTRRCAAFHVHIIHTFVRIHRDSRREEGNPRCAKNTNEIDRAFLEHTSGESRAIHAKGVQPLCQVRFRRNRFGLERFFFVRYP